MMFKFPKVIILWSKPTKEDLKGIPRLYSTEDITFEDKVIYGHFFLGGSDWYIAEYDPEERIFFGYAILNEDYDNAEWGYISYDELLDLKVGPGFEVEWDKYWKAEKAKNVKKIYK